MEEKELEEPREMYEGETININVEIKREGDRAIINVYYPDNQQLITPSTGAHILAGAIGVIIKGCTHNDMGIKDHELVKDVVDHIHKDFVESKNFEDVYVNDKLMVKETEKGDDK